MNELLQAVLAFAVLFALFGVYGLVSTRRGCAGSCGSCGSADACGRADPDIVQIENRPQGGRL